MDGPGPQRIVVPVDLSGRAHPALGAAARSAEPVGGRVRLVHVRAWYTPLAPSPEEASFAADAGTEFFPETVDQATELVESAVADFGRRGIPADGVVVEAHRSRVGAAIAAAAKDWGAELIVLCRRPRQPVSVWLLGSVSEQVMRESSCPVLVVPQMVDGGR